MQNLIRSECIKNQFEGYKSGYGNEIADKLKSCEK
jgi:hypothetical protein